MLPANLCRRLLAFVLTIVLFSPLMLPAVSKQPLTEDAALNLLLQTLTRDHVYAKRISLDCVTFETEETTRIYFEVALREKHNAKCGGDPDLSPVIDHYRVNRASKKIEWFNTVEDNWQDYNPATIGKKINN